MIFWLSLSGEVSPPQLTCSPAIQRIVGNFAGQSVALEAVVHFFIGFDERLQQPAIVLPALWHRGSLAAVSGAVMRLPSGWRPVDFVRVSTTFTQLFAVDEPLEYWRVRWCAPLQCWLAAQVVRRKNEPRAGRCWPRGGCHPDRNSQNTPEQTANRHDYLRKRPQVPVYL